MHKTTRLLTIQLAAVLTGALALGDVPRAVSQAPSLYALTNVKIVPGAGATIDKGTIVMRNGLIEAVGASVTVPADALTIDAAGMTAYPGLIDMANTTAVETPAAPAVAAAPAPPGGGGGGGRGGGGGADPAGWEEQQRLKREQILKPGFSAAEHVRIDGAEMQRLASAGITSVLAVPPSGTLRGQSALVNVLAPADDNLISGIADYRTGLTVVKAPVALHVGFGAGTGGGGRGGGYPGSLLGYIAFVRQAFYDAQWQKDARAYAERHKDQPRPVFEPELDAIAPALERRLPVAFDADLQREISRALAMAKEFNLQPIIVGGAEAAGAVDELKAANASVILTLNFPAAGGGRGGGGFGGGGGGRGGGGGEETLAAVRARVNAPRGPAALEKAGVPFAFTTGGMQNLTDFIRNAGRAVKEGGLPADVALRALTSGAARIAGVADRLGTIEKGKIANLVVTQGDLFDGSPIRHVFVDGRPVDVTPVAPPAPGGGRGRGGSR